MIKRYVLHIEFHRGYRPFITFRRMARAGDRTMNGGCIGTLITCEECSGVGLLHQMCPVCEEIRDAWRKAKEEGR